jgi:hypothetical protein
MTLAKSSALKIAIETQPEQRTKLPAVARSKGKVGQGVAQDQGTAFGQEADSVRVAVQAEAPIGQESSTQLDSSILTWQTPNAEPTVDLSAAMQSFTILAQAPASVLSDLPAKQAQSMAASAQWISLPAAGLVAVGAVIAGVAGGGSSGTPVDPAKKALDDKLDAIQLGLKVDSGRDNKDLVTNDGTLVAEDPNGTEPTGLQFSSDAGKTWDSLSKFNAVEGSNSVILRVKGEKDLVSKSSSVFTFTLDTAPPSRPDVGLKIDSGFNTIDKITNSVAGAADLTTSTLEAGVRIEVRATADGAFSPTFTPSEGVNTVQIQAVDLAGNASSPSESYTFTFDSTLLAVPTIGIAPGSPNDSGINSSDGLTKVTNPVLAGTAEPDSKLTIELVNGAAAVKVDDTPVDAEGKWQVALPVGTVLADGTPKFKVTITDRAGNTRSSTDDAAFEIDTKAPLESLITAKLDGSSDDGASVTDGITSNRSPLLSGTAEPGSTVAVSFTGRTGSSTAVADADGKWSVQSIQLDSGTWTPNVQATDAAGNMSVSVAGAPFTIEVMTAGLKDGEDDNTGISDSDSVTRNTFPTLAGYALPNASVAIVLTGQNLKTEQTFSITTKGDGTWEVPVTGFLEDDDYTLTIATLGVPGVSETPINGTAFTVDTIDPDVADVEVALNAASDTGVYDFDGLTSSTAPIISGTADPGDFVSVRLFGGPDETTEVLVKENVPVGDDGKWSTGQWSPTDKLTAGVWIPSVTVSDAAGNQGGGSIDGNSFEIVTQAASSTISLDPGSETGNSQDGSLEDGVISIALLTRDGVEAKLTGTVDAMRDGTTVVVTFGSVSATPDLDPFGSWEYILPETLADGEYSATVVVKDAVGLVSTETVLETETYQKITIDSTAPMLSHPADLVQIKGGAFDNKLDYRKLATDEVFSEDVSGRLTSIGFQLDPDTGAVSALSGWELPVDVPTFGWVLTTVTDVAGNVSVDEYQVAAVKQTTNYTTARTILESAAPSLYVDKTTGSGGSSTVSLFKTAGSVIQMGDGNDTVNLNGEDFPTMNFAALDGGAGTGDALSLNDNSTDAFEINLSTFNRAGDFGDGQVLTNFELLKFSTNEGTNTSGTLIVSPEDLYRLSSDLIDTVGGGSWSTLVISGDADDMVILDSIDFSSDDGVDKDFYKVAGEFSVDGTAGTGYTKLRAVVVDADGSHRVELLIATAVTLDPGSIELQRAYPVIGA